MSEEQPQRKSLLNKEEPASAGQPEHPAAVQHGPLDAILRRYGDNPAQAAVVLSEVLAPPRSKRRVR